MKRSETLRLVAAVLVAVGVVGAYLFLTAPEATLVKAGGIAPDLELPSLEGGIRTRLAHYRGRPVLLAMFLSSCPKCVAEIREIERVHREFLQRGLVVVGVAVDPDPSAARAFVRRHGLTFIVLEDAGGVAVREAYGSWKFPEAYLIDAAGRVEAVYLGSVNWRGLDVRDRIKRLLPPPRPEQGAEKRPGGLRTTAL